MKILKWLDKHFEETFLVILIAVIAIVELMQVVARNVSFIPAITWAEELCRFLWIWSVFLSLPYTIRMSSMLRVGLLADALRGRVKSIFHVFLDAVTGSAMLLLAVNSIKVVQRIQKSGETSPAMQVPMWIVYSIMLIGFGLGFLRSVQQMLLHTREAIHPKEATNK